MNELIDVTLKLYSAQAFIAIYDLIFSDETSKFFRVGRLLENDRHRYKHLPIIEHSEYKIIAQSGAFENEIAPGLLQ